MLETVKPARHSSSPRSRGLALSGVMLALATSIGCAGDPAPVTPPAASEPDESFAIPVPASEIPPPAAIPAAQATPRAATPVMASPQAPDPALDAFGGRLFRFAEARVHMRSGERVVVPIGLAPGVLPGEGVRVRLGDGPERIVPLLRVGVEGTTDRTGLAGWHATSPGAGRWIVSAAPDAASRLPLGAWVVPIDLPKDLGGARVFIEDVPVPLVMHDGPAVAEALSRGTAVLAREASRRWSRADHAWTASVLAPLDHSPLAQWRVNPVRRAAGLGPAPADAPVDAGVVRREARADHAALLDAISSQWSWRWNLALGRLAEADVDLARAVAARLLLSVHLDDARPVPVWPAESAELDGLLNDLLDPDLNAEDVTGRVNAWLGTQPVAAAWVNDDAGRADVVATDTVATIGVANLSVLPVVAGGRSRATPPGSARPGDDLVRILPLTIGEVLVSCPPSFDAAKRDASRVEIRVGASPFTLGVFAPAAKFTPPGFGVGPFAADVNHAAWLRGATVSAEFALAEGRVPMAEPAASPTAGLLHRASVVDDGADGASGRSRLVLYLECATATAVAGAETADPSATASPDFVRIWLGPTGRPAHVLAVDAQGRVVDQTAAGRQRGAPHSPMPTPAFADAPRTVRALRESTRWRVWLPIPDSALTGTLLRIGLERVAQQERSAWPRPMMPWQHEPGRAAVDISTWAK